MQKGLSFLLKKLIFIIDLFVLNFIFILTLLFFQKSYHLSMFIPYIKYWVLINILWIVLSSIIGVYDEKIVIKFELFIKRTAQNYFLWNFFILLYLVLIRDINFSRLFIILIIINFGFLLVLNRFFYFKIRKYIILKSGLINKIIILGYNDLSKKLANYFEDEGMNNHLVGFVDDHHNIHELSHYPILSGIDNVINIAKDLQVQEIFSTIMPEQNKYIYQLMNEAEYRCMRFKIVPDFSLFLSKPVIVDYIRDMPILSLRGDPLEDLGNRIKKRLLDIVVSTFATIFILSWLIPLIGILIKIESKGPIFFIQLRSGKNDKPFYCLKFRSMRLNVDSDHISATKNDERLTKLGTFIRKTSIDEFPQFINVFKGEMSLVGPRPHMVNQSFNFSKKIDHYMVRQFLKPGITGWAQINSFRGEIKNTQQLEGRVASDLWYLENWNIWLDARIIFLTVYQIFSGDKQAY